MCHGHHKRTVAVAQGHQHGREDMQQRQQARQQQRMAQMQIDPAVLDGMDPADRAAVLAATYGDPYEGADPTSGGDVPQQAAPPPRGADAPGGARSEAEGEGLPGFDPKSDPEELQRELAIAAENAAALRDLGASGAPGDIVADVARRCASGTQVSRESL